MAMLRWGCRTLVVAMLCGAAGAAPSERRQAPSQAQQRALELFRAGETAFAKASFAEAAKLFSEAYGIYPEPVLLYNLGRAAEHDGDLPRAIESYEQYLDREKDIADRAAIEKKVLVLRALLTEREALARRAEEAERLRLARATASDSTAQAALATSRPAGRGRAIAPWLVTGIGALLVGTGGALVGVAFARRDEALMPPSQQAAVTLDEQSRGLLLSGEVSLGVGAAVLIGGAVWGIVGAARRRAR